jgi:uncharacterized membrane protein YqaE (UPF0057 family)
MKKCIIAILFVSNAFLSNAAVPVVTSKNDKDTAYVSKEDEIMVNNAVKAFSSLSKAERKAKMKEVKSLMKDYKANRASGEANTNTLLLAILAILLPPLAVYLHEGDINTKFWISILLTLCFWIPGVIYALIVVL